MNKLLIGLGLLFMLATIWLGLDRQTGTLKRQADDLESRVARIEAAVKKLEHETSLRVIPLVNDP